MTQRTALILAAALTAFVLVLIGGVAVRAVQAGLTPAAAMATPTVTDLAPQGPIQQANEPFQPAPQQPTAPADAPAYAISPDLAATIALNLAPGAALTRTPELVNFQGTVAYEVVLDRGTVYLDANSGRVLYNGSQITRGRGSREGEWFEGHSEGSGDGD